MMKSRIWTLALCLLVTFAGVRTNSPHEAQLPSDIAAEDFSGSGFWSALACAGCIAGGVAIASGGIGAILAATRVPGSTLAVGACIAACVDAF